MISTRTHAILDYLLPLGIALLGRRRRTAPPIRTVMTAGPIYHLGYTALTRHEGGLVPLISMPLHLALDAVGALTFIGCGTLMRGQPAGQRAMMVAIGAAELAEIALSDNRSARGRSA